MSTELKNLSSYDTTAIPDAGDLRFGITISEWNEEITGALTAGAVETLLKHGASKENIILCNVPGSYELPFGAQVLINSQKPDVVICIGCVIQGETRHFEFICQSVSQGIMKLALDRNIPVIFGVLTTDTLEQAKDRSGGKHGNKGVEAAVAAIKMAYLNKNYK